MEWKPEAKALYEEFLKPVPVFVRVMIKKGIKKKIEEVASNENAVTVDKEHVIHGYILAAPKGSMPRVIQMLDSKNIDYSAYQQLIDSK
jgi:hypothetical protein